ncbi:MAG: ATP-dependent zinc protease [Candidatus Actinomarina sp.]|nr:RimK/LysX family protein [Actinomycetota bacterium]
MTKKNSQKRIVGWREYVTLTELNVENVVAKIDTGANLSSIHASDIRISSKEKIKYVTFKIKKNKNTLRKVTYKLHGFKKIKSSDGVVEKRPVIKTPIILDGIRKNIELTLTDRKTMDYTMLIGRKALGRRWMVNPAISFITEKQENSSK